MTRYKELQNQRNMLADKIMVMRDQFNVQGKTWGSGGQRDAWEALNTDYDRTVSEMDEIRGETAAMADRLMGQPEGTTQRSTGTNLTRNVGDPNESAERVNQLQEAPVDSDGVRSLFRSDSIHHEEHRQMREADLIVAAWARNSQGFEVPREEWEACERNQVNPGGNGFTFRLNRSRPTLGRSLRFAHPNPESRALSSFTVSGGGVTVPEGFVSRFEVALKSFGPMFATSEIWISEDGRPAKWPTLDDTNNEGVQIGESVVSENSDLDFGGIEFRPYKFSSGVIKCPHELLRDSAVNLAGEIGAALGVRLGRIVNRKATEGHGGATIQGIVPAATLGVTAAQADVVDPDELLDLIASVDPAYHTGPGVGFMMNQTTYSSILKAKTGDGVYLFGGNDKDQRNDLKLLRGYPVNINNNMANPATGTKPVLFGDLSKYKLRIVVGVRLRTLVERYADADQVGFIGYIEADGNLLDAGTHPVKCLQMA